jgi:hypothetical protein
VAFAGALSANPQASITVRAPGTTGVAGAAPSRGTYTPAIVPIAAFTDPYASIQLPPAGTDFSLPVFPAPAPGAACGPGNYVDVDDCGAFAPGIYVVTGSAKLSGNSTLVADDVLFYFTCSQVTGGRTYPRGCAAAGEAGGALWGAGNGSVTINGRASGPYAGFAVIYDRHDTAGSRYVGNGALRIDGAVYAAGATPDMRGNGSTEIHGALIAHSVAFTGSNATLTVTGYDVVQPPPPPLSQRVHLVP